MVYNQRSYEGRIQNSYNKVDDNNLGNKAVQMSLPVFNSYSVQTVSSESVTLSSASGVVGFAHRAAILNSTGVLIGSLGDTSFSVSGTALTTEVAYDDSKTTTAFLASLSAGQYAVDYYLGMLYYKKADSSTTITVGYKYAVLKVSGGSSGASALSDLTDVNLGTLGDGEVLTYVQSSGKWENQPSSGFTPQVTKTIYVDGNRTDTYTPDGSILKPFKTIQSAIDYVASLAESAYFTIKILTGVYTENVLLEDTGLKYIIFDCEGDVRINPASGNAIQSTSNNDNLAAFSLKGNLIVSKPIVITGSAGTSAFSDCLWDGISLTGTATIDASCMNNLSLRNVYSEQNIKLTNVAWSYIESNQLQGQLTLEADSTKDYPSGGKDATILSNGTLLSGDVVYTLGGTSTYTVSVNGGRWGNGAVTVPTGVTIYSTDAYLRGVTTNNGAISLRNSNIQQYIAGTGTLDVSKQPASQYANDSSVSGTTVKDALDTLDSITFQVVAKNTTVVTTTNATKTTITSYTPTKDCQLMLSLIGTDNSGVTKYSVSGILNYDMTSGILGSFVVSNDLYNPDGYGGIDASVSTGTLLLEATGKASTTVKWTGIIYLINKVI